MSYVSRNCTEASACLFSFHLFIHIVFILFDILFIISILSYFFHTVPSHLFSFYVSSYSKTKKKFIHHFTRTFYSLLLSVFCLFLSFFQSPYSFLSLLHTPFLSLLACLFFLDIFSRVFKPLFTLHP